jgi:hypothetical protein
MRFIILPRPAIFSQGTHDGHANRNVSSACARIITAHTAVEEICRACSPLRCHCHNVVGIAVYAACAQFQYWGGETSKMPSLEVFRNFAGDSDTMTRRWSASTYALASQVFGGLRRNTARNNYEFTAPFHFWSLFEDSQCIKFINGVLSIISKLRQVRQGLR